MRNTIMAAMAALSLAACDPGRSVSHIEGTGGYATCNWHDCRQYYRAMRGMGDIPAADRNGLAALIEGSR